MIDTIIGALIGFVAGAAVVSGRTGRREDGRRVLDEVALRAARQRYMIDATRMEAEAKKLEMAEYPLTARIWRARAGSPPELQRPNSSIPSRNECHTRAKVWGLWQACPSPLVVDAKEGVSTVVDAGVVLFLVVLFLLAACSATGSAR